MTIEVKDDPFGVSRVEGLLVLGGDEEEGTVVEVVGFAGHAFGVVGDGGDEAVAEELARMAGDVAAPVSLLKFLRSENGVADVEKSF